MVGPVPVWCLLHRTESIHGPPGGMSTIQFSMSAILKVSSAPHSTFTFTRLSSSSKKHTCDSVPVAEASGAYAGAMVWRQNLPLPSYLPPPYPSNSIPPSLKAWSYDQLVMEHGIEVLLNAKPRTQCCQLEFSDGGKITPVNAKNDKFTHIKTNPNNFALIIVNLTFCF